MSEIPDIYTNSIRAAASLYEFTLILGLQTPSEESEIKTVEVGRIRMSPQQAMALNILLSKHLEVYGEQFQSIFLPDDLIEKLSGEVGSTDE